jgi:hypothetical protein
MIKKSAERIMKDLILTSYEVRCAIRSALSIVGFEQEEEMK